MTAEVDASTTVTTSDQSGLAVAVGRIEEGQKYTKDSLGRIESHLGELGNTVAGHAVILGTVVERLDGHDKVLEQRAPIRIPWTGIVATIATLASLCLALYAFLR